MINNIFFSIIIPTYNRANRILNTLDSVLKQDFSSYEIIVVDDGSTDNTEQIIFELLNPSIKYFKTENFGVAHARNYGIKKALGKYVGFLDSDDLMEKNHLQTAYNFINDKNEPDAVHLNFLWGKEDRLVTKKNVLPLKLPNDIFKRCSLHVNCVFIKRTIVNENLFNESKELMFVEDWDFFIKLSIRFKIYLLDKSTIYLIDHEDRNMRNFNENKWLAKRNALEASLLQDDVIKKQYPDKIQIINAHMNSLIALNLAIKKDKTKSFYFWLLSLKQNFKELFTKRSLAIIKYLVFNR